jgi:hypothetical protein
MLDIKEEFAKLDNPNNHKLTFCDHCGIWMLVCGTCGNNSCNSGEGKVNGSSCPHCDNAHHLMDNIYSHYSDF